MIKKLMVEYQSRLRQKTEMHEDLFREEEKLLDYQWLLQDNPCEEIVITEKGVYANFLIEGGSI